MKVLYNNKEIANNTLNYNDLLNKPVINNVELAGNVTLNDINVYSKQEVDELIEELRKLINKEN